MANMRVLLRKLQTAHASRGRRIFINQFQNYSEKGARMVTKFVLSEKKDGKLVRIFETWQIHEAVKFLADELQ